MLDKDTVAKKLKEEGYDVYIEKGVVCARCPRGESVLKYMQEFSNAARMIGYEASLGVTPALAEARDLKEDSPVCSH